MPTSRHFASSFLLFAILIATANIVLAQTDNLATTDQHPGSVLFFTLYSSSTTNPMGENTRINITNTSQTDHVIVHLTFIDGATCSPADASLCLTRGQTYSLTTYDFDPGTAGYIVAVAVNQNGCPINFNYLIGDSFIKLASGHTANLAAEAVPAIDLRTLVCAPGSLSATLTFDGKQYAQLPKVLALDNIPSLLEGNSILMVLINPSGDLTTGANIIGPLFGVLYNDGETPGSFTFTSERCQVKEIISNTFPRTTPRLNSLIPPGRSGWMRLWSMGNPPTLEDQPLFGAMLIFNPLSSVLSSAFSQGHNMHILTLKSSATITIPTIIPGC